ncbi:MAG: DUF1080 domain-containing protein, partial [Verrucomicrobiota bacterium]
ETQKSDDFIFINPLLLTESKKNPFVKEKRNTDIDFGCNQSHVLSMQLRYPVSYTIENLPKNIMVSAPDSSFFYKITYSSNAQTIYISQLFEIKRAIYTKDEYSDFVARLEFKLPPGGNNGLAIRYPGSGDTAYVGMCELQVLDNSAEQYKKLDPRQFHGSAYGMAAARREFLRQVGEWNFEEVTVKGSTIKVELNGTTILETDLSKVTDFMDGKSHPGKDRKSGHFGFAGHNDPVQFRNIQVKPLQ